MILRDPEAILQAHMPEGGPSGIAAPAAIAAAALGIEPQAIRSVEPIKHGLTNESWLVRCDGDAVVVRLSNGAEDALQIDRQSEARILAVVAAAGIGPPVLLSAPARHVLVTRYLGETWTAQDALCESNIDRLAALLRRLHELEVPAGIRHVELVQTVDGYLRTMQAQGIGGALTAASMRARAFAIARALQAGSSPRLCHNDVHHLNVVPGPTEPSTDAARGGHEASALRLIDWEYAGCGEPLFDLASVCVSHSYDARRRERLLLGYSALAHPDLRQHLELACWLFEYVRDLWLAVREHSDHERGRSFAAPPEL